MNKFLYTNVLTITGWLTNTTRTVCRAGEPQWISDLKADLKDIGEFVQDLGNILDVCTSASKCYPLDA